MHDSSPLITNDAIVFGMLTLIITLVFNAVNSKNRFFQRFFRFIPAILLCYILPSLLSSFNIISPKESQLWSIAKDYFLPASLILMTLSIDLKAILGLGNKALIMFFTATLGIILGGPIAVFIVSSIDPEIIAGEGSEAAWRGFATVAGSWIGGGANQAAMLELYGYSQEKYSTMVAIDIIVSNIWMIFLLYGAGNPEKIDRWLRADSSSTEVIKRKLEEYTLMNKQELTFPLMITILGLAFTGVGLSHLVADIASSALGDHAQLGNTILANRFFWIVVVSTTFGLTLSFTRFRRMEGAGASRFGSVFIYLLIAIIGTKMQLNYILENIGLVFVGLVWMSFHVALLFIVAWKIRAPFFFLAVGSKANVGGAASAPVVAAAFHPALAPVGVLLAVLGYALGTYGAIVCAQLMQAVS